MEKEVGELQKRINCESSSIWLRDEEDIIYPYFAMGPNTDGLMKITLELGQGIVGRVIRDNTSVISNDLSNDPNFSSFADSKTGYITNNILCLPIVIQDYVYGCVEFLNKDNGFNEDDLKVCEEVVSFMSAHI